MSYRPQVKADSNGTTQDLPIDAETVQGKTPVFTTTNQTIEGVKTYTDIQTFKGGITLYAESGDSPRLTFQRGTLIDTAKDWSLYGGSDGYLYIQQSGSSGYETRATFTTTGVDFVGTIKENGTSLADKYATKSEFDNKYLPLSGGTLTGNLTGKYITGTWLQTTAAGKASVNTGKVCVLDNSGLVYYRTPAEIVSDGGGGNTTPLYKHELYVSIGSTAFNTVNGECYFDLYTPQSTPYTTQALIENALKNYGGAIVGGTLGSYQIVKIEYTSDNDGIGVYTWQDEIDYQIAFSYISDKVTRIL